MRRVFIVNDGGHNYADAKRFGEITFCTDKVIRRSDTAQMYRELNCALATADAEDYLLVSSLTSLCIVAAGILAAAHGELHLLIYEGGQYVARDIMFDSQE